MKYENLDHGFGSEDKEHMEYREKADTLTSTRSPYHRTKVRGGGDLAEAMMRMQR